jgi:hypothetical protein
MTPLKFQRGVSWSARLPDVIREVRIDGVVVTPTPQAEVECKLPAKILVILTAPASRSIQDRAVQGAGDFCQRIPTGLPARSFATPLRATAPAFGGLRRLTVIGPPALRCRAAGQGCTLF